jgi:competence protein ComEC
MRVRRDVQRRVGAHDAVSAAIVSAILIGDRAGLPDEIRRRLQAAGTYHVIAISGGNIAILAGLTVLLLGAIGVTGRPAALATIVVLLAYAQVAAAGASVWRATLMATLYFVARLLDHRSPPWQAMAAAAALLVSVRPLDVRDVGFLLTFGATAALLEAARRTIMPRGRNRVAAWVLGSVAASVAAELALLPVNASVFSRVTSAGLVLNLLAVPLMGVVQLAGMAVVTLAAVDVVAGPAGWVAHLAAQGLIASAGLVDMAPWLTTRVPPPPLPLVVLYYGAALAWLSGHRVLRSLGAFTLAVCAMAIATGSAARPSTAAAAGMLRLTVFDVGQGDAALLQLPDRSSLLVDTGGSPFGGGFDIGARVLVPAMWSRGVRSLDRLLLTHGDPDHVGGAAAAIEDFRPRQVWEGIPVPRHVGLRELLVRARQLGADVQQRRSGEAWSSGAARLRVLHPPPPEWERQRVRNDDSVVLEVRYGDVAILLPGDVGAAVERTLIPHLRPARIRILKVAHHGSRTSSSLELLQAWRPHLAVVSAGRGNTFGHPAPEVIERLESVGATILRTDLHGQITIETNGREVAVRTFVATEISELSR